MIGRLRAVRIRLFDAVVLAGLGVLGLKLIGLFASPAVPEKPGELPAFARVLAHARTNYIAPDVAMTGAVEDGTSDAKPPSGENKAENKSPRTPPTAGARPDSPAERALLERLGERREEIQQKSREIEMRERLLENAERKLEARLNELKALETKASPAARQAESEAAGLRNLVTMYETMKPKDAARVFDRLSHDVLVPVVLQMNPRKMAEILAVMSPEAAEKLTVALAQRARGGTPEAKPGAPTPLPLPPNELPAIPPGAR